MRRVTLRKLHEETGKIVDQAEQGEVIVIQRRGVPVARLVAFKGPGRTVQVPDFDKRYARFPRVKTDSGKFLETDRR
jgi:prevent-host-death family protein